jgi:hypothetical protein
MTNSSPRNGDKPLLEIKSKTACGRVLFHFNEDQRRPLLFADAFNPSKTKGVGCDLRDERVHLQDREERQELACHRNVDLVNVVTL